MVALTLTGCDTESKPFTATESASSLPEVSQANLSQSKALRASRKNKFKARLSDYELFIGPMKDLAPAHDVIEYELNTPLFTDYAQKQRLVRLPVGTAATYTPQGPLDFPVGTIIAKTFYYAHDLNDLSKGRRLIETRIMEHQESGWIGIPYLWDEDQSDARLAITGGTVEVTWKHTDGDVRTNAHAVPNLNDCKRCHTGSTMQPIGPKARNLNRDFVYADGSQNQLVHWAKIGALEGLPELDTVSQLAVWDDNSTGSVNDRARAYLEVNCGHCHNPAGPARNSGLHLNAEADHPYRLGVFKTPVAAGKGTGGRLYAIVPGKPHESIMEYRMQTVKAGEVMPEFGKALVHKEGLALLQQWIAEMD
ncbi:SO2930 family diheme c-type cytochrome [Rubripirellula tenax]|uniref:SO2930 family diheme c-type cytochrome n=1 Tax=Rubripirellula tenax TaxID=2528015 RepID=UPI00164940C3|nr:SO2930 family diheme c-type cytochrome [Rubripirellula tenax]